MINFRKALEPLALAAAISMAVSAQAQSPAHTIDIQSQPLSTALNQLSNQTGTVIVAPTELVQGLNAKALSGDFTSLEALKKLLADSNLSVQQTDTGALVINEDTKVAQEQREIKERKLSTITVFGERSESSVAETASSVTVFSSEDIEELSGKDNVDHLLEYTPNVSVFGGNGGPTIRGQDSNGPASGSTSFATGALPRTTIQVDGRPTNYSEFIYGQTGLWDIDQVEIYTGPQTTTQGANSIAGAVFIKTKNPTEEFEADAQVVSGSDNTRQISAVLSGPLFEDSFGTQLTGRLSVDKRDADTWRTTATTFNTGNATTDFDATYFDGSYDPDTEELKNIRGKLLFKPDAIEGFEALFTINSNDSWSPQTTILTEVPASGIAYEDRRNTNTQAHWTVDTVSNIAELSYQVNDDIRIKNTTSYAETDVFRYGPVNGGNVAQDSEELVNELLVSIDPAGSNLSGSIGVYYRNSDEVGTVYDLFPGKITDEKTSKAVFGELNYQLTDDLDLTLGARASKYQQKRVGALAGGFIAIDYENKESMFLPRAELNYWLDDNTNIGASISKGYNPGGLGFSFTTFASNPYEKETVLNYELFARGTNVDETVSWKANLFYMDFTDQQRTAVIQTIPTVDSITRNAEEAVSYGFEGSVDWKINSQLDVALGLGLLQTEIKQFDSHVGTTPLVGNEFSKAPEMTAMAFANYRPNNKTHLNLSARYNSGYFTDDDNTAAQKVPSYIVVDARGNYQINNNVELFGYVTNLFDEFYLTEDFGVTGGVGSAYAGDPREMGIGIKVSL